MQKRLIPRHYPIWLILFGLLTVVSTLLAVYGWWQLFCLALVINGILLYGLLEMEKRYAQHVSYLLEAIRNKDYTFRYATVGRSHYDQMIHETLNQIAEILAQAKIDTIEKEKYYAYILNTVHTGILIVNEKGYVLQSNHEASRLLGTQMLSHIDHLARIDKLAPDLFRTIRPGEKQTLTFSNERGNVNLSLSVNTISLQNKVLRVFVLNDIHNELEQKEVDAWIRLTRVLTHEIMNGVTPITSLSETLLSLPHPMEKEIRDGLDTIRTTGKSLIDFVESYRRFTHLPTPHPALFYVKKFLEQMKALAVHQQDYPNIQIDIQVDPEDLIVYADEKLILQVVLNLLKNAMQAIGTKQADGHIWMKAYCNSEEAILIEIKNNGPIIPPEEINQIFIPFFTTKTGGSGIGLPIARQIMRLSGGSLTLISNPTQSLTTFVLTFP